jgi:hypothetical protein
MQTIQEVPMRRIMALAGAIAAVAIAVPAEAGDLQERYSDLYVKVAKEEGKRAPGRNIVKYGLASGKEPTRAQIKESIEVLDRILNPPPLVPVAQTSTVGASYSGGVPAELEAIAQCESGGDYSAVNPTSGAYGKYQIMPSTAAAYGCDLSTAAGQDQCAVEIYAGGAGRGQWVC